MATPQEKSIKNYIPRIILVLVLLSAGIYAYQRYQYGLGHESTDNAQIETYTVPVVPRVSGYVNTVNMKDFEQVKKGQLLVDIDDQEQQLALAEMEAVYLQLLTDVENAKANIKNTKMTISAAETNLKTAVLRRDKAQKDSERDTKLLADNAITRRQAETVSQGLMCSMPSMKAKDRT